MPSIQDSACPILNLTHYNLQIDRENYGKSSSSPFLLPSAPGDDSGGEVLSDANKDTSDKEETAHGLITRLTKFIYNCSDVGDIGR